MSGQQHQARSKTSPKQGPLRATMPITSVTKEGSGLREEPRPETSPPPGWRTRSADSHAAQRSPGPVPGKGKSKPSNTDITIRKAASLDTIYVKGLFPRDRSTQTDVAKRAVDPSRQPTSPEIVVDNLSRMAARQTRASAIKESHGGQDEQTANSYSLTVTSTAPSSKTPGSAQPKSSRSSEEGLNQEVERLILSSDPQCDRLREPTPEGRKAPVADLFRIANRPSPTTQMAGGQHSSEDSQGSSPDQERMVSGSSPRINRFLSRAPPDGCERVLSKSVPIIKPIPIELVPQPRSLFTLTPSSRSAFESLNRDVEMEEERERELRGEAPGGDDSGIDSPFVPGQDLE